MKKVEESEKETKEGVWDSVTDVVFILLIAFGMIWFVQSVGDVYHFFQEKYTNTGVTTLIIPYDEGVVYVNNFGIELHVEPNTY